MCCACFETLRGREQELESYWSRFPTAKAGASEPASATGRGGGGGKMDHAEEGHDGAAAAVSRHRQRKARGPPPKAMEVAAREVAGHHGGNAVHPRRRLGDRSEPGGGIARADKGDSAGQGVVDSLGIPEGGGAAVSSDSHRR